MAPKKSKDGKNSKKKLQKKTKAAKKTLKELKKEKQAAASLMNYYTSMGKYFSDQAALEEFMGANAEFPGEAELEAAEVIPYLKVEVGDTVGETSDEFLKGFYESEEYAKALVAYKKRMEG